MAESSFKVTENDNLFASYDQFVVWGGGCFNV